MHLWWNLRCKMKFEPLIFKIFESLRRFSKLFSKPFPTIFPLCCQCALVECVLVQKNPHVDLLLDFVTLYKFLLVAHVSTSQCLNFLYYVSHCGIGCNKWKHPIQISHGD